LENFGLIVVKSQFVDNFLFKHIRSTTYYLEGNEQAKSTHKVIGTLFTKFIGDKHNDWDEFISIIFFLTKLPIK
jgi:hypothetical protein